MNSFLLKNGLQINPAARILVLKILHIESMAVREEVQDQYGNIIYLTDERWRHIIKGHYQIDGHRDKVLSAVRSGKRTQDPLLPYKFYYTKAFSNLGRFKEIEVVVLFRWKNNQSNNFIVTAYPN